MWKKVRDYIIEHQLAQEGERVMVALSGGADSVGLMLALKEISENPGGFPLDLKAVHVHHGLRGEEADRDSAFCRQLCKAWEIPFETVTREVRTYALETRISVEEAGRILRYEALGEAAAAWGADRIALAHHMDDQAETILHNLVRGSGLRGLGGIRPVQGNRIRPLLGIRKEEICRYLNSHEISWCEDSSNASQDYTRNRIRSQILPIFRGTVNENATENIIRAGEIIAQADEYLEKVAGLVWEREGTEEEYRVGISICNLLEQDAIVRTYLLRYMVGLMIAGKKDITARHYGQMEQLLTRNGPGICHLPGGFFAVREYESFWIEHKREVKNMECGAWQPHAISIPQLGGPEIQAGIFQIKAFKREKGGEIPKNQYTKWFDYDRIKGTLWARNRKAGDSIVLSDGGTKTVARYMIDEKIPKVMRENIIVLAEDQQILWIVGHRISEIYKITEATRTILQVSINGGESHGR